MKFFLERKGRTKPFAFVEVMLILYCFSEMLYLSCAAEHNILPQ